MELIIALLSLLRCARYECHGFIPVLSSNSDIRSESFDCLRCLLDESREVYLIATFCYGLLAVVVEDRLLEGIVP